jgi:hypothetical protein
MENQTNMNPLLSLGGLCFAFIATTASEQPFWLVIMISVLVPVFIGVIVKGMDIAYKEYCFRRDARRQGTGNGR